MEHPQKCLKYMVVDTKSSTNLLWMAIRVEEIIHPVDTSERTGMIQLLVNSWHNLGVGVEKLCAKFQVLGDPLMIHESKGCSHDLAPSKCKPMLSNCEVSGFGCDAMLCLDSCGVDIIIDPIVDPIIDEIIMVSVVYAGITAHDD